MSDFEEMKALIPLAIHRVQLKRIISLAEKAEKEAIDNIMELIDDHPALAMFTNGDGNKENVPHPLPINFSSLSPSTYHCSPPAQHHSANFVPDQPCYTPLMPIQLSPHPNNHHPASICQSPLPTPSPGTNSSCSTPGSVTSMEETSGLPKELPFPQCFSIAVERAVASNAVLTVRLKLINDISSFYYGMCRHPRQGDYSRIARKVCERFPELKDVNTDKYWKSVQQQVSMFFRNARRKSMSAKRKLEAVDENCAPEKYTAKPSKVDDNISQERNVALLKGAKQKDVSKETMKKLMDETYNHRRQYIKHEAKSTKDILEQYPSLSQPQQVLDELARIITKEKVVNAKQNLQAAVRELLKENDQEKTLTNKMVEKAIGIVESRTKKKGSGKVISFHDPTTKPSKMFQSKIVEFRIICTGTVDEINQIFIAGEDDAIVECPTTELLDSLILLVASYYVFDVSYPVCYNGLLGFLQDVGLSYVDDVYRSAKYSAFLAELKNGGL